MPIIDRYLLRQFVQIFTICFVSMAGLYIVIDLFGNLDDFLKYAGDHGLNPWTLLGRYYAPRTIGFFDQTSGMLTLIAAMFTIALFQRYNEMTALEAAGIRKWRIIRPVVTAVIAVAALAAANRELVIPQIRDQFARNAQDLGGESGRAVESQLDRKTGIIIRGNKTFANRQRITKPAFRLPSELSAYGNELLADDAFYLTADQTHPGGYLLTAVSLPKNLASKPSLRLGNTPIVLTGHDYPWLKPDECFVVSDITFELLASAADWRRYASLPELFASLRNPSMSRRADVCVAAHSRIVQPVLDVLLLFLGLPLVLARYNRNVFFAIGLCVAVVVAFYLVVLGFQYLGSSYIISPSLAAWFPLLLFVPIAAAMSNALRE